MPLLTLSGRTGRWLPRMLKVARQYPGWGLAALVYTMLSITGRFRSNVSRGYMQRDYGTMLKVGSSMLGSHNI